MKNLFRVVPLCLLVMSVAACADVDDSLVDQANDSTENVGSSSEALVAAGDYDFALSASRKFSSFSLAFTSNTTARTTRNNKMTAVVATYRLASDAASVRRAISGFGGGTVTNANLPSYSVTSTVKFKPSAIAAGTYYLYLTYTTNGDDRLTYIYRASITT